MKNLLKMIKNNFITEKPSDLLDDFLINYNSVYNINIDFCKKIIQDCLIFYKENINQPKFHYALEKKWYESTKNNIESEFDYSVYNDKYHFATDLWPSFVLYSRKYILNMKNNFIISEEIKNVNSIIDLGCGIGYSTAMLKQMYPDKKIIGTNLEDTEQYKFCKEMGKKYNFDLFNSEHNLDQGIDLVFASEYFEHIFDAPINVQKLINKLEPKYLYLANTFRQTSIGHFNYYKTNIGLFKDVVSNKKISKIFNSVLKDNGYTKIKTGLWNDRPNFWKKNKKGKA